MADIQLRFNHDMLVLSSPITTQLQAIGVDTNRDNELTLLLEPEVFDELYALESAAGAQVVVADTASLTPARLARTRMEGKGRELAEAAIAVASKSAPQHVLAEIGPCGLPLDPSSKASLVENRDQYKRAVECFAEVEPLFDGYFLNGFCDVVDLKCSLMGLRSVTDKPVFASVDAEDLADAFSFEDAVGVMAEYGAQVVGFATFAGPARAAAFIERAKAVNPMLPVLAQLAVKRIDPEQNNPTDENPYPDAELMVDAADALKAAGAQFLRAVGNATPAYTGALVAATLGDLCMLGSGLSGDAGCDLVAAAQAAATHDDAELEDLAAQLRARINEALGG